MFQDFFLKNTFSKQPCSPYRLTLASKGQSKIQRNITRALFSYTMEYVEPTREVHGCIRWYMVIPCLVANCNGCLSTSIHTSLQFSALYIHITSGTGQTISKWNQQPPVPLKKKPTKVLE